MTFNSSQTFKTHPSTNLLKFLLTPELLLPLFKFRYISKVKAKSKYFVSNNCFLGKLAAEGQMHLLTHSALFGKFSPYWKEEQHRRGHICFLAVGEVARRSH